MISLQPTISNGFSWGEAIAIGTGLLQFAGVIWGAATLKSKIDSNHEIITLKFDILTKDFALHKEEVGDIESRQSEQERKVAVLWDGKERREGVDDRRDT